MDKLDKRALYEQGRAELRAKIARQRQEEKKRLATRRQEFTASEWQELELMRVQLDKIMSNHPKYQHALWHAYADLRDFTEIA